MPLPSPARHAAWFPATSVTCTATDPPPMTKVLSFPPSS